MALKLTNNAVTTLAASITAAATSMSIQTADAGKFPILSAGDWHPATIIDPAGNMEIVRVTARNNGLMTVVRAQEGTTAKAFAAGSRVDVRLTVAAINEILSGDHTHTMEQVIGLIDALNARVSKSGDTMTGALNLPQLNVNRAAGVEKLIAFLTSGNSRWAMFSNADPEGGSNLGSNFVIARYNDAGNYIDAPFYIQRATGIVNVSSELLVAKSTYIGQAGGGLEIGKTNGQGSDTPYIDFHTSTIVRDYNARIIATGADAGVGGATLDVQAANFTWAGSPLWSQGNLGFLAGGEAEAGTSETKRVWSAADVKRAINALAPAPPPGIGVGQTWTAPTRGAQTLYQNTTGRAIYVIVRFSEVNTNVARYFRFGPDTGVGALIGPAIGSMVDVSLIIPDGYYYMVDTSTILTWLELR